MKAILCFVVAGVTLILGTVSVGQNPPQPLLPFTPIADPACDSNHSSPCNSQDVSDCGVGYITGDRNDWAYLNLKIVCDPDHPNCGNCYACAFVQRSTDGAFLATASTTCPNCVATRIQFEMGKDIHYRIFCCLRSCDGNCSDCSTDCYATAYVDVNP